MLYKVMDEQFLLGYTLNQWWQLVASLQQTEYSRGTVPRIVDNIAAYPRVIKLCRIQIYQLAGLGDLVKAQISHPYIQGTVDRGIEVRVPEIFADNDPLRYPFVTDPHHQLPGYLAEMDMINGLFYLHVSSTNGDDSADQFWRNVTEVDFLILGEDTRLVALMLEGGYRELNLPWANLNRLPPLVRRLSSFGVAKNLNIRQPTPLELQIVYDTLDEAIKATKPL